MVADEAGRAAERVARESYGRLVAEEIEAMADEQDVIPDPSL